MATKKCANGHIYDPNVYGDNCPFCPSGETVNINEGGHTRVNNDQYNGSTDATRPTQPVNPEEDFGGGTVIRHVEPGYTNVSGGSNRKLVGLLVCYDLNTYGQVFNIYEGRNMIGRKATVDIPISGDQQVSSEHLVILYREAEGVFWCIDNKSSNGTFVNEVFQNETQLKTNDVIRIGNTRLIFIAIPKHPLNK